VGSQKRPVPGELLGEKSAGEKQVERGECTGKEKTVFSLWCRTLFLGNLTFKQPKAANCSQRQEKRGTELRVPVPGWNE